VTDRKISELTNITGANLADDDEFVVVDTSVDETKAITYGELKNFNGTLTSGGLTVDTNTLHVDSTNNRVGIGTSSPSALLQVETADGTAGGAIMYTASGVASGYMSANPDGLCLATDTAGITFRTGITGADPTDTGTERMRIDSSGSVGIGTVPEAWHSAFNGVLQVGTYGVMAGTAGSAQFGSNFYYDGAYKRINNNYASRTYQENGNHVFETAATGAADSAISFSEAMRIDSSGYAIIPAGVTLGTSAGTYVAANTLDDYEEGTHQTAVTMGTSGTVTLSTSFDRFSYTKIGRLVTITGHPRIASVSSPVGSMSLTLPFAAASGQVDECRTGGVMRYYDNSAGSGSYNRPVAWSIQENTSTLAVDNINTNGNNFTPAASDEFYFSISYITA